MQYVKEWLLKRDSNRHWAFSSAAQELWVITASEELNARGEFQNILLFNKWHNKKNAQAEVNIRISESGALTDHVRSTCSALEDTTHNFAGSGGENWTLNNDTDK